MANVNPLLLVGAVIGVVTVLLVFAYASVKDKKGYMGFERNMADGEIVRRLVSTLSPMAENSSLWAFWSFSPSVTISRLLSSWAILKSWW